MTAPGMMEALHHLRWSQADLSRRLGVHVNTVTLWATGKGEVPGYVSEYLRVMSLANEALRHELVPSTSMRS